MQSGSNILYTTTHVLSLCKVFGHVDHGWAIERWRKWQETGESNAALPSLLRCLFYLAKVYNILFTTTHVLSLCMVFGHVDHGWAIERWRKWQETGESNAALPSLLRCLFYLAKVYNFFEILIARGTCAGRELHSEAEARVGLYLYNLTSGWWSQWCYWLRRQGPLYCFWGHFGDQETLLVINFDGKSNLQGTLKQSEQVASNKYESENWDLRTLVSESYFADDWTV